MRADTAFAKAAAALGYAFDSEIKVGVFQLPKNATVELDLVALAG